MKHDECALWPYAKDADGYGYLRSGLNTARVHRLFYELLVGPIPAGMHVLHSCDKRACVNPLHLRVGTHAENMAECKAKGRNARGTQFRNSKLNDDAVRDIRASKLPLRQLAAKFGISLSIAHDVKRGLRWRHVK